MRARKGDREGGKKEKGVHRAVSIFAVTDKNRRFIGRNCEYHHSIAKISLDSDSRHTKLFIRIQIRRSY